MTINPRVGVWFSIFAAVVSTLLLCGAEFTTIFGTVSTTKILAGLGIVNAIVSGINAVLHMIPSASGQSSQFALGPTKPAP